LRATGVVAVEPAVHLVDLSKSQVNFGQLRAAILASQRTGEPHLWLINAASGLPVQTLRECGIEEEWRAAAEWMAEFSTAREWRRSVRRLTRKEPRRAGDVVAKSEQAPMNLRRFKRTWSAVVELLLPLAVEGVRIAPVAGDVGARVVVAEAPSAEVRWHGPVPREAHVEGWIY
jgi:hypothetical protein